MGRRGKVNGKYIAGEAVVFLADAIEGAEVQEVLIEAFSASESVDSHDVLHYRIELAEKISSLPHVASTSTFVSMETVCE